MTWNDQELSCVNCPAGSTSRAGYYIGDVPINGNCTLCPVGHASGVAGSGMCAACAPGSYAATRGSTACATCAASGLNFTTTVYAAATSPSQCVCAAGAWLPEWPRRGGRRCERCPHGAFCAGGAALPIATAGFWTSEEELHRAMRGGTSGSGRVATFWRCSAGELACPGGDAVQNVSATCAADRAGPRCAACAASFHPVGTLCSACNGEAWYQAPWFPSVVTFLLIIWPHVVVWLGARTGSLTLLGCLLAGIETRLNMGDR